MAENEYYFDGNHASPRKDLPSASEEWTAFLDYAEPEWVSSAKDEVTDLLRMEVDDFFEPRDNGFGEVEPDYTGIAHNVVNRLLKLGYLKDNTYYQTYLKKPEDG